MRPNMSNTSVTTASSASGTSTPLPSPTGLFNAVDHFSGGPVDHHGHNTVVKAVMDKRLPVEDCRHRQG